MRDSTIHTIQRANEKRDGLILAQFEFLKTRQEAFEVIWASSSLWERLGWLWEPEDFLRKVSRQQSALLDKARADMAAAAAKAKIAKPSLVVP